MDVFFSDSDRKLYISLLQKAKDDAQCNFLAWCLMSNHVHFIIIPKHASSFSDLFRWVHAHYTRHVNKREDCIGHLWQERFHSSPLSHSHLCHSLRYILLNPVKAGLARRSTDYRWSSARFTFNPQIGDPLISKPLDSRLVDALRTMGKKTYVEDCKQIEFRLRNNFAYAHPEQIQSWESEFGIRAAPLRGPRR